MGLIAKFKNFQEGRQKRRLEKAAKLVKNPKAIRDDRWAALSYLAKEAQSPSEEVIRSLLSRFEYSLEHGINDSREKDLALEGVLRFAAEAEPIIVQWLKTTDRIAWPLKALKTIASEQVFVNALESILMFEDVSLTASAVNKNFDVLCYLRDYQLGDFAQKLVYFLNDPDERVRFAACEVLIEQENQPSLLTDLEKFLKDDSVENRRLKQSVVEAYLAHGWKVKNPNDYDDIPIMDGIKVQADGGLAR